MTYSIPLVYAPGGLNLRLPETLKNAQEARDGLNWSLTPSMDLVKRMGYQMKATSDLGYGLAVYERPTEIALTGVDGFGDFAFGTDPFGSPNTLGFGDISLDLVGLDDVPKVWSTGLFQIDYSGSDVATVSINAADTSNVTLTLTDNGSTVLTQNLGIGNEASPVTLTALKTAIDAVSNFTATVETGTGSVPAALLDYVNAEVVDIGVPFQIGFGYWSAINSPITTPMPKLIERISRPDFENPTTVSMNGVLYIMNGYDSLLKYDGQTLYKAGLNQGGQPTGSIDTLTSVGATFDGVFNYRVTYEQTDAVGNIIQGRISNDSLDLDNSAGPYAIDVTVTNILASEGFNTNGGISTSTQTSTNVATGQEQIGLDDGAGGDHTLQVGDKAYFFDTQSSTYGAYEVLAVTGSTATLKATATVGLTNNAPVSNNLKVKLWRAEVVAGVDPLLTDYKLVVALPNDSFNSSQDYKDEAVPASLGEEYVQLNKTEGNAPNCRYGVQWRNQLVMAGNPSAPSRLYYSEFSDSTSPENFPAVNFKETPEGGGGKITGMGVLDRNLFIFNENRVLVAEGNLAQDSLRIDTLADHIGCVAHHTIQVIDNSMYFLSSKGVARISRAGAGYRVEMVSLPLNPLFRISANNTFRASLLRAVAVAWTSENKYVIHLPAETSEGGFVYPNASSRVLVYDIERNAWLQWSNINPHGGIVEWDDGNSGDVLWFHSREAAGAHHLHRFNLTKSEIDYVDHGSTISAVEMEYWPQWDFLGAPKDRKSYTELSIDSFRKESDLAYVPSGDITVGVYHNFNADVEMYNFTVSLQSDDTSLTEALSRDVTRSIGLKLSNNTINKQTLISGWALEGRRMIRGIRRL